MIQLICQSFTSWISLGSHLVSIVFERYNNGMSPTNLRSSRYSLSSYYVNFTRHLKVNFDYFPYLQGIKITTAVNKIGEDITDNMVCYCIRTYYLFFGSVGRLINVGIIIQYSMKHKIVPPRFFDFPNTIL